MKKTERELIDSIQGIAKDVKNLHSWLDVDKEISSIVNEMIQMREAYDRERNQERLVQV